MEQPTEPRHPAEDFVELAEATLQPVVGVAELAAFLGVKPGTVRNALSLGHDLPPAVRIGRRVLFSRIKIIEWLRTSSRVTARGAVQETEEAAA